MSVDPNKLNWERWTIAIFKFGSGLIEAGFGAVLLVLSASGLTRIVDSLVARELLEDPTDLLAIFIQHRLPAFIHDRTLFAVALIGIGSVKIVAALGFVMKKAWGYYALLILIGVLLPFDLYHLALKPSLTFGVLAIAQISIVWFLLQFRSKLV